MPLDEPAPAVLDCCDKKKRTCPVFEDRGADGFSLVDAARGEAIVLSREDAAKLAAWLPRRLAGT